MTLDESAGLIRVEERDHGPWHFISAMHAGSRGRFAPDAELQAFGLYNEAALWSFAFMTLSGVYLWVATRPGLPWARLSLAAGTLLVIGLWAVTR